ncbi:hypothetical protein [Aeromicrobium wangtongii]|uniref:Uncharacterized protein n=1 Tax=Aeromicrobium wangtongii TaxID=2969247 RepID=A0ABY5MCS4_9ACTN|nr:hypothetical protein [Aeromicrobium wangtongii]MCD9197479.1 hypothetical protein [Aeromicrobium wangtongii]UUP14971.1 hypothetical protein NQV15_06580 [Aeromicrobium wangtongii]
MNGGKRVATPTYRTAPIREAARVLNTTVEDLREAVVNGTAVGVDTRHGESVKIVLMPGAAAPELVPA